ncbi:hypothetical protein E2C01_018202 [Portunus trituberculatus]|uniref:Uncharacterized protein n=1 Tax=Portunus trituberculatus TaxID=210409 RepID=A0A5B7DTX0_PORTR|nr:hypothetical protein [Portunus trituberculatus]
MYGLSCDTFRIPHPTHARLLLRSEHFARERKEREELGSSESAFRALSASKYAISSHTRTKSRLSVIPCVMSPGISTSTQLQYWPAHAALHFALLFAAEQTATRACHSLRAD